jgi:hypothetical protein
MSMAAQGRHTFDKFAMKRPAAQSELIYHFWFPLYDYGNFETKRQNCSADFQSAVSPNCIRQAYNYSKRPAIFARCGLQIRDTAD